MPLKSRSRRHRARPLAANLHRLATADPKERQRGSLGMFARVMSAGEDLDLEDRCMSVFGAAWRELGLSGAKLVRPLATAMTTEENLLTLDSVAIALSTHGPAGLTALVALIEHDDFSIRHKAAFAIGVPGPSARWTVPNLDRALRRESQPVISVAIVQALGRIGGDHALETLNEFLAWLGRDEIRDDRLSEVVVGSIARAEITEVLGCQ